MAAPAGLQVSGVTVRFGGLTAVDGAGLTAPPGAVTGLVGPDGAGKTTLCDVIAGLRRPAAGTVRLGDADLTGSAARERARRGIARTSPGPAGSRTVRETVRAAAARHALTREYPGRTARDRWRRRLDARRDAGPRAEEILARVGIAEYAERCARAAPPGVALLTGLARALAAEPAVLLLDEPWAGMPARHARALEVLLRDLAAEGLAVLVVERELEPVLGVCDVLHVLDGGRVIAAGAPAEVRADPRVRDAYRAVTTCRSTPGDAPRRAELQRAPS
ncbi:ABC transporter ATP-binding protein [Actinomadura bangladeshensis]|uniref:ATP-binding cassette domain-containing protein n=1 Tax=Actinomadura bangladeshensis TaxID=453573 RepID=A0A4R4N3K7_9ACTN|nr:ATP-binding cassette domain-containing protein [Actinomadura bangladeshensis]TDC03351.1 ATP-binding cassette domain-containing protein [Actinomadura bangladeshensis]